MRSAVRFVRTLTIVGALVVVLAGSASALSGGAGADPAEGAAPTPAAASAPAPLVEALVCAGPTAGETSKVVPTAGTTAVSFVVAAMVRVRLDASGTIVAATSNTGCAPRTTDLFSTEAGAPLSFAQQVSALGDFRSGDWTTPGVWHLR